MVYELPQDKSEGRWSYTPSNESIDDVLMQWENLNGEEDISPAFLKKLKNNVGVYVKAVKQGDYNPEILDLMENVLDVAFRRVQDIFKNDFMKTRYGQLFLNQYNPSRSSRENVKSQPQLQH